MKKSVKIEYGCCCNIGKVRKNNEDNFYCAGEFRSDPDSNEETFASGVVSSLDNELFAVFDGMGGEACGEIASFIAAQQSAFFCEDKGEYEEYLYELCEVLNERILEETKARSLVLMGTTCAMIQFFKDEIYIANAGDSRIYKYSKNKFEQISVDHVAHGYGGKAPLTKFLGTPDRNGLMPYIARGAYKANDIFVLCTDGVYDMVDEEMLKALVSTKRTMAEISKEIVDLAVQRGGVDNATVILCKISK